MTHLVGDDLSNQITALTGLVSAVGVIVLGYLQYLQHKKLAGVKDTAELTALAVSTRNGHTLGDNSDAIADALNVHVEPAVFPPPEE